LGGGQVTSNEIIIVFFGWTSNELRNNRYFLGFF
jgi:hypothetical protein